MTFVDRTDAGRRLAQAVAERVPARDALVLALPRGGVPVAREVAALLGGPLDVFVVRKLGVPGHEELAAGAIASGGVRVVNEEVVRALGLTAAELEAVARREQRELERRERVFRAGRPPLDVSGRVVVLVDDGLATGSTMRAAIEALRKLGVAHLIVAVPVGPADTCRELAAMADELICLEQPEAFFAIGRFYRDFRQVEDAEVQRILTEYRSRPGRSPGPTSGKELGR